MSTAEVTEQKSARAQAVDEEYEKLERFHINCRRIVLVDDKNAPEGGFGVVRRAELYQSAYLPGWLASRRDGPPQSVAVKQIKITKMTSTPRVKRAFTREMLVWSSLEEHPGIAKFIGFYADFENSKAWLISPWEPNGNVSEFVKSHNLEVPEKLSMVYDTIDASTFLHQLTPPVCHGDIKSANVLVTAEYKARLCDFGLARLHEDSGFGRLETSTGNKGSIRWCSPELIDGAPRTPASDVYAWAWLVWEIMTGDLPFEGLSTDYAIIRKIFESPLPEVNGQSRLSGCVQTWGLLTRCWIVNPAQRPTSQMCKTTMTNQPRCTPTLGNADHQTQSAALLENLGDLESWKGNLEKSSTCLEEALRLYHEQGDAKGIASVLLKKAAAADRISDYVKSGAIATTALEHCRALNDPLGMADASFYIGCSIMGLDGVRKGLPLVNESLEIRRRCGDDFGAAQCLMKIGDAQRVMKQNQEALSTLGEALELVTRSGNRSGLVEVHTLVGVVHRQLSDDVKAADAFSEAILIARSIGWEGSLSLALIRMGELKNRLEAFREAEELLREATHRRPGKFNEGIPLLEESALLCQERSQQDNSKAIASFLVELHSNQGNSDRALFWQDHVIALCRSQEKRQELGTHLLKKGHMLAERFRHDEAMLHFEAFIAICRENGGGSDGERGLMCFAKTAMSWERPLLCDLKKLQRRKPQLNTATLKLPITIGH